MDFINQQNLAGFSLVKSFEKQEADDKKKSTLEKNINWKLLKGILFSWFITLPITGFLSAGLFSFGFYSP